MIYNENKYMDYKKYNIYFDEPSHCYSDNFGNSYTSVTTLLHRYKPEFKKEYWAKVKATEECKTIDEIKDKWKNITQVSCDRGNITHNSLELGIRVISKFKQAVKQSISLSDNEIVTMTHLLDIDKDVKPLDIKNFIEHTENKYPEIYRVFKWYVERDYKIYSEIGVFNPELLISGLVDVPVIREDNFVVLDWKTNKDGVKFTSGYYKKDKTETPHQLTNQWVAKQDKLLPPVANMDDCNGSIYNLQLSLYAYLMEQMLNRPCVGIGLCHIGFPFIKNKYDMPYKNEDGLYIVEENKPETITWHKMNYRKKEIELILADHKRILMANNVHDNKQYNIF